MEFEPRYKVEVSPPSWVLPNRTKFVNWVDRTFKYKKVKEVRCPACDDENGECPASIVVDNVSLFPHQSFVKDYMQFASPYRGLLLMHFLGSGKTCSSIAAAEILMNHMDVIIMLPASLRDNYIAEIKKCGNQFFNTSQHWVFQKATKEENNKYGIAPEFAKKQKGIWVTSTKGKPNFDKLTAAEQTQINAQISHIIENKYHFISYNGLQRKHIEQLVADGNPFDNKVVIVDEIHNLVSRIVNGRQIGSAIYKLLMSAKNCKLILLSGTPIINYPFEIAFIVNLLAGYIKQYEFKALKNSPFEKERIEQVLLDNKYIDDFNVDLGNKAITFQLLPLGFSVVDRKESKISKYQGTVLNHDDIVEAIKASLTKELSMKIAKKQSIHETTLLPEKKDEFNALFVNEATGEVRNPRLFMKRILGTVSYYNTYSPALFPSWKITDVPVTMTANQFVQYEKARANERKKEKASSKFKKQDKEDSGQVYRFFSRAVCNFVFPDDIKRPFPSKLSDMKNEIDEDEELLKQADKASVEKQDKADVYAKLLEECLTAIDKNKDRYFAKGELGKYSPKYAEILKNIEKAQGNVLIYSQFRKVEGLGLFGTVLESNGWSMFKIKSENGKWVLDIEDPARKPTFATFTGNNEESRIILRIFNNDFKNVPESLRNDIQRIWGSLNNLRGEIIKVMMITQSGAEGISLKNTRQVHIMEPYWNHIRMDQVIGRAVRTCSHVDLQPEERNVEVFIYYSKFSEAQTKTSFTIRTQDKSLTSDEYLYSIAKKKKKIADGILDLLKRASVDCALNANNSELGGNQAIKCFSFPVNMNENKFVIQPKIKMEEVDEAIEKALEKGQWKGQLLRTTKGNFIIKEGTNDVYDYDVYLQTGRVLKIGVVRKEGTKRIIDLFD